MHGVLIHEGVGRCVVRLPQVAEAAGQRGEQDEEVQRQLFGGPIQVHRASHFRAQHRGELLVRLLDQEAVPDHPGAVQHAIEPAVPLHDPGHALEHRGLITHV